MTLSSRCGSCTHTSAEARGEAEIGRRDFLARSALLAAAAALAACGVGADTTAPNLGSDSSINVPDFASLSAVGGVALITVSGARLAIVRTGASSFAALSRICPHQGSVVNQSGAGFLCPNHGAQFSSTGQWVGGQRTTNLHSYPTSYDPSTGILSIS
jgi:cytochrome b6-f complex iron-sulfur subunit